MKDFPGPPRVISTARGQVSKVVLYYTFKEIAMSDDANMSGVSRRDLLCAGGATMFSSLVTGLLGGVKPARAQALSGATPEVERLAVRVVTDSYHLAIAPNLKVGGVEVQRFGMPPAGKSLHGEFGLALHLESTRGNETRHMLLD